MEILTHIYLIISIVVMLYYSIVVKDPAVTMMIAIYAHYLVTRNTEDKN